MHCASLMLQTIVAALQHVLFLIEFKIRLGLCCSEVQYQNYDVTEAWLLCYLKWYQKGYSCLNKYDHRSFSYPYNRLIVNFLCNMLS